MATDFKYASQSDLEMYYPNFSSFDTKRQIFGWTTATNLHTAHNSGLVTQLFINGEDLGDAVGTTPDTNGQWWYVSATDKVQYFNSGLTSTTILDQLIEGGIDNATFFDQMLTNASMELNNLLDGRYSTPLDKVTQIDQNTDSDSQAKE